MAKQSITQKLKALQKKWEAATPATGGSLPDGDYEGVIKTAVVKECKDGTPQCVWELEVTAPNDFVGRKQTKFDYLGGDRSFDFLQGSLMCLGIDPPDEVIDIPNALGQAEGLPVAFRVRTKQENTNIYFIGVLEGGEVETTEDNATEEGEDTLTAEMITAMGAEDDEDGLQAIIDEYEIDLNQDDYETYPEVADEIIAALEL